MRSSSAQQAAGQLLATILLVATTSTMPRPALALEPVAPVGIEQPLDTDQPAARAAPTTETVARTVTVAPRDSWWRLAETHLGDGLRWREIRDLNQGRTVADGTTITADTDVIHPGWELAIPTEPAHDAVDGPVWTVEPGDNLWDIAETTLATNGHDPTDLDTADYWHDLIDRNTSRLPDPADPDLILPGQHLHLPTITTANDPAPSSTPTPPGEQPPARPPASTHEPAVRDGQREGPAADQAPVGPAPHAGDQTAAVSPEDTTGTSDPHDAHAGTSDVHGDPESDDHERTVALLPPALAATALIGAGALEALRRRRRRAYATRRAGMRFPTPHPGQQAAESRLAAAAMPDPALDQLWSLLRTIPEDAQPTLLRLHDGQVTLTFDTPQPDPPQPWTHAPNDVDGRAHDWTAADRATGPARSVGLPLLVTLGRTDDGDQLLANLAACGPITVDGDPDDIKMRLRTMTLEVATSAIAHRPDVLLIGDDTFAHLDGVRTIDDPAPEIADRVTAVARGIHAEDRTPLLVVCHDDRPITIPACTDLGLIRAGADQEHTTGPTLHVEGNRGRFLTADGTEHLLHLPDLDPEAVDDAFTALDHPVLAIDQPDIADGHATADTNGAASSRDDPQPLDDVWCTVRLLGPVDVHVDGNPVVGLTPLLLELMLFLATHRDSATPERIQDAVWPEVTPRLAWQRARKALTRLRTALGDGPDGEPLVPHRTRDGDGRITLSRHVATDLDQALGSLEHARREQAKREQLKHTLRALDRARGEPFQTIPLSWSTEVAQRAIIDLQDAAERAAALAVELGRHDDAIRMLRQGLLLLPGTEMLYVSLARVEADRGRSDVVDALRREFEATLTDDSEMSGSGAWDEVLATAARHGAVPPAADTGGG